MSHKKSFNAPWQRLLKSTDSPVFCQVSDQIFVDILVMDGESRHFLVLIQSLLHLNHRESTVLKVVCLSPHISLLLSFTVLLRGNTRFAHIFGGSAVDAEVKPSQWK